MFNKDYVNKVVYPKGTSVNVRAYPITADKANFQGKIVNNKLAVISAGNPVGRSSGTFWRMKDGDWYQIMFYKPIENRTYGYCRLDVIKFGAPATNTQAEQNGTSLLNDLIKSDVQLYKNLLINSELIENIKKRGIDTSMYQRLLEDLIKKYNERQTAIKTSNLVKTQNWLDSKWQWIQKKWSALVSGTNENKVGIAPLILVAIGGAVGIATSILIYYAFKPRYDDAKIDLKDSEELQKALAALSPEEANKLQTNLEVQLKEAYEKGRSEGQTGGILGTLKNLGLLAVGFWLADRFVFNPRSK